MDATIVPPAPIFFFKHDAQGTQHAAMCPAMRPLASTSMFPRPGSSSRAQPPTLLSNGPSAMTPASSPQPAHHKPAMMLDTEFGDYQYLPATPPLSTSGSPKSFEVLQAPMNPMFSGLDDLSKTGLEPVDLSSVLEWSSCGSPPMTPSEYPASEFQHTEGGPRARRVAAAAVGTPMSLARRLKS